MCCISCDVVVRVHMYAHGHHSMDVLPTQARALAALPGMRGRITYGQGLVWDEAYDILMELSVLEKVICVYSCEHD